MIDTACSVSEALGTTDCGDPELVTLDLNMPADSAHGTSPISSIYGAENVHCHSGQRPTTSRRSVRPAAGHPQTF